MLRVENISKRFGGVTALRRVSWEVEAGEVHALLGENGAGKSTLIKILAGVYPPQEGRIILNGREARFREPAEAIHAGISVIYQDLSLFPNLSVAENIAGAARAGAWQWVRWQAVEEQARQALASLGVTVDPRREVGRCSVAVRQMVAIARALAGQARLFIMDEPTAALSREEVDHLFVAIGNLRQGGCAVVFVSHRLEEVRRVSDRVSILRDGEMLGTWKTGEIDDREIVRRMVGRDIARVERAPTVAAIGPALELDGLGAGGAFEGISLALRPGEVLALAGLEGSGAREVARSIAGFHPFDRGAVRLAGRRVRHLTPALAVAHGVAYVPEDRHAEGLALSLTVAENVSLAFLDRLRRWGVLLDRRAERRLAAQWIERLAVRPPEPDREVAQLSGGNQQKVLVAKWLAREPQVLVLDSPTVGVDVAAKAEIHDLVRKLAAQRTAVMLVSSDWTEVLDLADRILVMARGRMRAEFSAAEATEETLMAAAMGS